MTQRELAVTNLCRSVNTVTHCRATVRPNNRLQLYFTEAQGHYLTKAVCCSTAGTKTQHPHFAQDKSVFVCVCVFTHVILEGNADAWCDLNVTVWFFQEFSSKWSKLRVSVNRSSKQPHWMTREPKDPGTRSTADTKHPAANSKYKYKKVKRESSRYI